MFVIVYFVMIWAFTSSSAQAGETCSKSLEEQMLEKMLRIEFNMELLQNHAAKQDADIRSSIEEKFDWMEKRIATALGNQDTAIEAFNDSQTAERTVIMEEMQRWSKEWMHMRTSVTEQLLRNKKAMQSNSDDLKEMQIEHVQIQEELELIDSIQTPLVAFNTYGLTSETLYANAGMIIKFQHILLNDGLGYNNATGVFTAPVAGLYQFTVTVHFCNVDSKLAILAIVHNGVVNALSAVADKDFHDCGSVNTIIMVRQGDTVHVKSPYHSTSLFENHYRRSSFLGYLIHE